MAAKPTYEELENRVRELERKLAGRATIQDARPRENLRDEKGPPKSAEKYRLMVENANEAILVAQDDVFVFSNPKAEALFGYSEKELGSRPLTEFVHEADRKMVAERHEGRLAGGTSIPEVYIFRIIDKSGGIRWVNLKVAMFSWVDRPATLCFMADITKRKQAEDALHRREARFRLIFEQSTAGIAVASADGRFIDANQALCDMLGYTREELLRMTVLDVTFPDDRDLSIQTDQPVLNGKQDAYRIEKRYRHKDGRSKWADLSSSVSRDDNGSIRYAIGVVVDITERKCVENALKEKEAFLGTLLNAIPAPIFYKDKNKQYLGVNDAFEAFFGKPKGYLIGKTVFDVVPDRLAEIYHAKDNELFESGGEQRYESQVETAKGELRDVIFSKSVYRNNEGAIAGIIGAALDITERKRAETALKNALVEKEILLREIHHRVKNNMQTIVGLLRMHARRIDNAQLTEIFNDCRDRIGAMSLIHEALYQSDDLAKIDFEGYLKKLCRNLAQAHDAQGKRIALTANAADVSLNMDQGIAVGMIIAELISNAFKHAFPDGETGTVSVHLDCPDGETARLIVSDTGEGLPEDFDIRNPSSLGMRLVAGAVTRELGGSIDVETGDGARFIIRFKQ